MEPSPTGDRVFGTGVECGGVVLTGVPSFFDSRCTTPLARCRWILDRVSATGRNRVLAKKTRRIREICPLLEMAGLAEQDNQLALGWRPTQRLIRHITNRPGRSRSITSP
jgi:hypothetical protein